MSPGVDHAVGLKLVRQINMRPRIAKTKLQDFHSWNPQAFAQRADLRRDHPKLSRWNLPITFKAAEVIEPDNVARLQGPGEPLHPPIISAKLVYVPTVQRIAPTLAGGAERIGRDAGHDCGLQIFVQIEKIRVAPDVGAVIVDEDGHDAHDFDSTLREITPQRAPLLEERKLNHALNFQFALMLQTKTVKPAGFASRQFFMPRTPCLAIE